MNNKRHPATSYYTELMLTQQEPLMPTYTVQPTYANPSHCVVLKDGKPVSQPVPCEAAKRHADQLNKQAGWIVKIVDADAAFDALTDAITDLLHVHEGDVEKVAAAYDQAYCLALTAHYPAEAPGDENDGVIVRVIR